MHFCSNKSFPIGLLLYIALHNVWHLKGVYKYHKYERPKDRWDFRVWDLRTPIRHTSSTNPASAVLELFTTVKVTLFGQTRQGEQTNNKFGLNHTTMMILDTFEPINNKEGDDTDTDAPYLYQNYLHQPLSKKNSPGKIYFHVICGSVPIFTGAANLLDFMRTTNTNTKTNPRSRSSLYTNLD
mmetsp:Transcript_40507/g.45179  ORF Transcript_40507/g.45179 Transcript_40507/m.45179 type:complete len:183 (-) Transcript_40507:76-624(-)